MRYIKLSQWAKNNGVSYRTAWNYYKKGELAGKQLQTGTVLIEEDDNKPQGECRVVVYARVSSSENKSNLDNQASRLVEYCNCKGYRVHAVVKEIGSGLNDRRPKLEALLRDRSVGLIVVEHKDRLCRFGLNYIDKLLQLDNRHIEIVNNVSNDEADIVQDFVSIITSFCARLYGKRRSRRKTEELIKELKCN
jgi:predicted site-specific integrase-resolvase